MPWNWNVWRVVRRSVPSADLARERVERQPLRGRADAARHAHAHHELIARLEFRAPALIAQVAIVLLVDPEELGELRVRIANRAGQRIRETFLERAAQEAAVAFEPLVRMQLVDRTRQIGAAVGCVHQYTSRW